MYNNNFCKKIKKIKKINFIPKLIKPKQLYLEIINYNNNYYSKKKLIKCLQSENTYLLNKFKNNNNYKLIKYKCICDNKFFSNIYEESISITCYITTYFNDSFLQHGWTRIENLNFSHNNPLESTILIITNKNFNEEFN